MNRVYDKIADHQFEKHLKEHLNNITKPSELNTFVISYFDQGILIRNDNAGKKIKNDLVDML